MGLTQCCEMESPEDMVLDKFSKDSSLRGFLSDYQINDEILGEGDSSIVRSATHKDTGEKVAIKVITKNGMKPSDERDLRMEIDILRRLNHANVVRLLDFFEEPLTYIIVMEYIEGGELFEKLVEKSQYSEREARDTVWSILSGVKYIHDRNIVHRDIRPENLLLLSQSDNCTVKLADFGFATEVHGNTLTQQYGTPEYVAPEILSHKPYGKAVDMWSVGVVAYCLLGGYLPFHHTNKKELFRMIRGGRFDFPPQAWAGVSDEAKCFIRNLLVTSPEKRYTVDQAIQDSWFSSMNGDRVQNQFVQPSSATANGRPLSLKIKLQKVMKIFSSVKKLHQKYLKQESSAAP